MPKTATRRQSSAVQSPLETYLREINETALLTADEEKELAREIDPPTALLAAREPPSFETAGRMGVERVLTIDSQGAVRDWNTRVQRRPG